MPASPSGSSAATGSPSWSFSGSSAPSFTRSTRFRGLPGGTAASDPPAVTPPRPARPLATRIQPQGNQPQGNQPQGNQPRQPAVSNQQQLATSDKVRSVRGVPTAPPRARGSARIRS